jgi:hypothetical protein
LRAGKEEAEGSIPFARSFSRKTLASKA